MELLKVAPFPEDLLTLGKEGIIKIWHEAKLRGRGYSRVDMILKYAEKSVGLKEGADAGRRQDISRYRSWHWMRNCLTWRLG